MRSPRMTGWGESSSNWFGQRGGQIPYIDVSQENALPEVGQDRLLDLLGSLTGRSLGFAAALQPRYEQSLLDSLNSLDPAQDVSRARTRSRTLMGSAAEDGLARSSRLRRLGFGRSVQAGAELEARNAGARRAQDSLLDLLSPESRQRRYSAMAQISQSPQLPLTLASRQQGYGLEGQRRLLDQQSQGGVFGGLLDILSSAAPYFLNSGGGGRR